MAHPKDFEQTSAKKRDRENARRRPFSGLPDLRESIQSAISNAIERSDLRNLSDIPRKRDLDALNENLKRVAEAMERLEEALRDQDAR